MKRTTRVAIILAAAVCLPLSHSTGAQVQNGEAPPRPVAKRTDVYCTGYIADQPPRADLQLVGGEKEMMKQFFAQGDVVYLNKGRESGIQPGAAFLIIRPLGEVKHPFTYKKVGHLVREVGMIRVLEVNDMTSTAEVTISCDTIEYGDLLRPYEELSAPEARHGRPFPRFGESSGGTTGQIIMSRGFHEFLSANSIVYVDLGARHGLQPGDYFSIYRKVGKTESIRPYRDDDVVQERSGGYGSDRFRGGDFSIEASRVPREKVLKNRPPVPRKVVGELMILKVEKSTAVAMILRTTEEVVIGDFIERGN